MQQEKELDDQKSQYQNQENQIITQFNQKNAIYQSELNTSLLFGTMDQQIQLKNSNDLLDGSLTSKKRGRKSIYDGAEYPHLIDRAKLILPEHNFDLNKILELEEFQPLKGSRDISRFINKFILNKTCKQHSKSMKEKSICSNENASIQKNFKVLEVNDNNQIQNIDLTPLQPIENLNQQLNVGAKTQSEITSINIREYLILNSEGRTELLWKIFNRNSNSLLEFLQNLKTACSENQYNDMFRTIYELNQRSNANLQIKTRLFVLSLLYYNYECIDIDEDLLKSAIILLAQRPNTEQALGLSNYIFINEPDYLRSMQEELIRLDKTNIGIIPLMIGTFQKFKIDFQVVRLLPNTLLSLNKAFIQVLKDDSGLRLIRDIPINLVGDFVQICALSNAPTFQNLDNFIYEMSTVFIEKWDFLDQRDFSLLLSKLSMELKIRNPLWLGKLDEICKLSLNLSHIQQEKGIRNREDIVNDCLRADFTKLNQLLHIPNKTIDLNQDEQRKILKMFGQLNKDNNFVQQFCKEQGMQSFRTEETMQLVEKILGFGFLSLQAFCLNFLHKSQEQFTFINFGVGNGKTLLCSTYAAIKAKQQQITVFVIGKNDHLVLRDEKNFESLLIQLGLSVNVNQFSNLPGVYYMTQKFVEANMNNEEFESLWKKSLVVIDEYDWIMLEGIPQTIHKILSFSKKALQLIGFTGSTLNLKEHLCIQAAFKSTEIKFPKLSSVIGDKKVRQDPEMIITTQLDFCKRLFEFVMQYCRLTPIVIVAQSSYSIIENFFKKQSECPFYSLKTLKGTKLEAQFDLQFLSKNLEGKYGTFLLDERQGRGTDLKSNHEIEFNGGLFLIVADIFSSRSMEQIIGRVGRLSRKGQYKQIFYKQGSRDEAQQVLKVQQQILENQQHMRLSLIQTIIEVTDRQKESIKEESILNAGQEDQIQTLAQEEKIQEREIVEMNEINNQDDRVSDKQQSNQKDENSKDQKFLDSQQVVFIHDSLITEEKNGQQNFEEEKSMSQQTDSISHNLDQNQKSYCSNNQKQINEINIIESKAPVIINEFLTDKDKDASLEEQLQKIKNPDKENVIPSKKDSRLSQGNQKNLGKRKIVLESQVYTREKRRRIGN